MAKIGEGHAAGMGRLGLKELRNAVNPSRESVADTEVGLYGTATQLEVNQDRGNMGRDSEQEAPRLTKADLKEFAAEKAKQAEAAMERGRERGEMEL
jgi:hypothetical protein